MSYCLYLISLQILIINLFVHSLNCYFGTKKQFKLSRTFFQQLLNTAFVRNKQNCEKSKCFNMKITTLNLIRL